MRLLPYSGSLTIGFGIVLITRTRGVALLLHGEWGALIIGSFAAAIGLLGTGDGALRPAVQTLVATGDGLAARRWALTGLSLSVLAIGMMTRALYARS